MNASPTPHAADGPSSSILLISGSTRDASTNTAALRTAAAVAPAGVTTDLYMDLASLPAFNPDRDRDPLPHAVAALRGRIANADAILFCTPEYAGALPGSFKNLLDWAVGGGEINEKPVAWLNVSSVAAPTGGKDAHESLEKVLSYLNTRILHDACFRVPVARAQITSEGFIDSVELRDAAQSSLLRLTAAAQCARDVRSG